VGGTAIGRALNAGLDMLKRLRARGGETRGQVILLLTDGEDTVSEPMEMADEAAKLGVKIFAVGIGSRSASWCPKSMKRASPGLPQGSRRQVLTSRLPRICCPRSQRGPAASTCAPMRATSALRRSRPRWPAETHRKRSRLVKRYDEVCEYLLLPAFLILVGERASTSRRRKA